MPQPKTPPRQPLTPIEIGPLSYQTREEIIHAFAIPEPFATDLTTEELTLSCLRALDADPNIVNAEAKKWGVDRSVLAWLVGNHPDKITPLHVKSAAKHEDVSKKDPLTLVHMIASMEKCKKPQTRRKSKTQKSTKTNP